MRGVSLYALAGDGKGYLAGLDKMQGAHDKMLVRDELE